MTEPANVFTPPSTPYANPAPAAPVAVPNAPPGTVQSSPDITPAQLLWNEQQRRGDAAAGRLDQTKFVQVKDPVTGAITTRPRTAADGPANPDQPATSGDPAQPQQTAPDRIRVGDLELTADELKGLMERRGLEESRKATMPASAAEYNLPDAAALKLPEGMTWQWNLNDPVLTPLIGQAKEWAFANGLGQEGFSKMMGMFAAHQIAEQQAVARAAAAEVGKLGAASNARVDAVKTFLHGHLGAELATALTRNMHTERQVVGFEKLMSRFANQGVGGNPGAHRDVPDDPRKVSNEDYARMSYSQKVAYTQQFAEGGR
jgi:hypothetical protein